ncbi:MAG: hypothetical protein CL959_01895 [Euryarchaeota archaeon]|nr:hypothetical protein [Euryarchaeota archaeon]|tara:strand:+ start:2766 stop:2975 length:210 start_codon:yes stop_codon:yes gene_type:complete
MAINLTGSNQTTFSFSTSALNLNESTLAFSVVPLELKQTTLEGVKYWTTSTFTPPLKPSNGFLYPRRQD